MKATVEITPEFYTGKCVKCRFVVRVGNIVMCNKGKSKTERCIKEGGSWFDSGFRPAEEDMAVLVGYKEKKNDKKD
jgi:hypothetical protein